MMPVVFSRRRALRALAALGLVVLGLLATHTALAQTAASCSVASNKGTDGPVDWGAYCWIDFSGYNAAQAANGGQYYIVSLPGGAMLSFTLTASNTKLVPVSVPSYSGASFGNSAFLGITGKPVVYQSVQGVTNTVTLSNLTLNANGSPDLPFVFIAADGESTNNDEHITFYTSGASWDVVAAPGQGTRIMPGLSGVGTQTVVETGKAGTVGSYVFATDNSPGTVTATLDGGGLQGVLFGLKFHSIDLAVTKTYSGDHFAGGSGSYQLDVTNTVTANQHPPTTAQPIRVVDTLPAGVTYTGFSGAGWSCSVSGQTVTCDLPGANLDTAPGATMHLPLLTLNVSLAANASGTLTNTATVQDHTTGYVFDTNQANNTTQQTITLNPPDLSTSTKTVVDVNGGDAEPGDVLQYTITLTESAGAAVIGASVSDPLPAAIQPGSLDVVSVPAGSTDGSASTGGSGSGLVLVSNISVAANGSAQIVYQVTIDSSAQPGDTVNNVATITNPSGPGASPSVQITVAQPGGMPTSGNKILYVYGNGDLTRTPQAAGGSAVSIDAGNSRIWSLTPVLQKPLTVTAGSTVSVNLMVRCARDWFGGCLGNPNWTATLYDNTVSPANRIGSTGSASFNHLSYAQETANISVGGSSISIPAGHKLILQITNNNFNFGNLTSMQVEQYSGGIRSTVRVTVSTVINVDSVGTYDDANCSNPVGPVYETNGTVYICAVVSDPFGSYDIAPANGGTWPTMTITDADGAQQVNAADMTQVADSGAATKTFRYTYTLPTSPPATLALGDWTASVTAWEGTEHTIHHTANGTFEVGAPDLVIVKSVSVVSAPVHDTTNPKALPGARMRYAIILTNQGTGPVDAGELVITDPIPDHTTFVVGSVTGNGAGSGLSNLAPGDISYSDDGGSTWTYTPSAGANGTDPAVTNIRFTPAGSMNGKTGTSTPTYTIAFDVILQ